jgi:hypothetical protein
MSKPSDSFTKFGAGVLAASVETYWRDRGFPSVRAHVEPVPKCEGHWQVRSNIGWNGCPPGIRPCALLVSA